MPLLEVEGLVKSFGKRRVVDGVSLTVDKGEIVGLLGKNGAGKTTTFRMTIGMLKPETGAVRLNGEDLAGKPMYLRARKGLGYLSQEPSVFQRMTVEDNILAILETLNISEKERRDKLELLLDELGIKKVRKTMAYSLSGGERRRLEITRALAISPKLILLDEPFSGVDPIAVFEIQEIVAQLRDKGMGILLTDHNVTETLSVTDRAYLIDEGKVWFTGTPEELVKNEKVRKLYLGERFSLSREIRKI